MRHLALGTVLFLVAVSSQRATAQISSFGGLVSASANNKNNSIECDWALGELITDGSSFTSSLEAVHGFVNAMSIFLITGDIEPAQNQSVTIFPVPFQKSFYIQFPGNELNEGAMRLYDAEGRSIDVGVEWVGDYQLKVTPAEIVPGYYFLQLQHQAAKQTFKLIRK